MHAAQTYIVASYTLLRVRFLSEFLCWHVPFIMGVCNADCNLPNCSDDITSAKEHATCVDTGISSHYCVHKGFRHGKCMAVSGWACKCITLKVDADEGTCTRSGNLDTLCHLWHCRCCQPGVKNLYRGT